MAKTITVPVSDELHQKFREYCIKKGVLMKDALTLAIQMIINKRK